ncbi:MAG: hypothetical protein AB1768_19965 [Pseudomonadota bacterium]|jgi:hypothetical protein
MDQLAVRQSRDTDRIERIRTPAEARIRVVAYTAPLCRVLRKDYNIVATKMFLARGRKAQELSVALRELERASIEAELFSDRYRRDYGVDFPPQAFDLRVISPFANRYRRCISRLDAVNLLLLQAETKGIVRRKERMQIVRPCLELLHEVKRIALDLPRRSRDDEDEPDGVAA